ncbi:MAG: hypothetical protein AAGI50_03240 [Pseudomonadota bacterium]
MIQRRLSDQQGTVTIEFVILVPVLFAWLLGSFIYFDAYRSRALSSKVANMLSDLAAREVVISDAGVDEFYTIQRRMLPRRVAGSWMRISSICYREERDAEGEVTRSDYLLHWSVVEDAYFDPTDADATPNILPYQTNDALPEDVLPLMADGDSVLLTEIEAVWEPVSGQFSGYLGLSATTWRHIRTERPRYVRVVSHVDTVDGLSTICPPLPALE